MKASKKKAILTRLFESLAFLANQMNFIFQMRLFEGRILIMMDL